MFANYKAFDDYNILMPKLIEFTRKAYELKGIELAYHDDIKELIKEIYRNV